MNSTTISIIKNQEKDIIRVFDGKLKQINKSLEHQKRDQFANIDELLLSKSRANEELEYMKLSANYINDRNAKLQEENKKLRAAAKASEAENYQLITTIDHLKKRLKRGAGLRQACS